VRFFAVLGMCISVHFSVAVAQATTTDLCTQKKQQYGSNFISCNQVDWGMTPLSASYQPFNAGQMTAPPSEVPGYKNDHPGIANTQYYYANDFHLTGTIDPTKPVPTGLPLAAKFINAVALDPNADPSLVSWLQGDWYQSMQAQPNAAAWKGKCDTWSSWSMDPKLQNLFSGIKDGILCSGIPFSKGELKEIVTSLYAVRTDGQRKDLIKFYSGASANMDELDDANVALSKMGVFGQGDLQPSDLISLAQNAKDSGKNMKLDRDPSSRAIWNQPMKRVTDIAHRDSGQSSQQNWGALSSADFVPATDTPEQRQFLSDLRSLESQLTLNLIQGNGVSGARFCQLRSELSLSCDDLNGKKLTLGEQVNLFNQLKQTAFSQNKVSLKQGFSFVKHELVIEYGDENNFASNGPDKTVMQSYDYTAVMAADGSLVRSEWTPRTSTLSQICSTPSLMSGRNDSGITLPFNFDDHCSGGLPVAGLDPNREYFTGAVPPKTFQTVTAQPGFKPAQSQQQQAYNLLLRFLGTCPHFDDGVQFLDDLDQAMRGNSISGRQITDLVQKYAAVKNLLEPQYIQYILDNKYQGVQGVGSLKSQLKL